MLPSKTITGFIIFWFLVSPGLAYAEPPDTRIDIDSGQDELISIEKQLDKADNSLQASRMVVELRKRIATIRSQSRSCIDSASARISTLTSRREALGEAEIGEDVDVGRLRTELGKEILGSNKGRAACEQLAQVSQELFQRTLDHEQSALKARLFARGIATPGVILDALSDPQAWARVLTGFVTQGSGWQLMSMPQRWSVLVALVLLFLVGVFMRRYWFIQYGRTGKSQYWVSVMPWLITGTGIGALLITFLPNAPLPPITRVVAGVLGWVIIDVLMRIWLDGRKLAGLSERDAKILTRWVRVLTGLFILGGLFTTAELIAQLPDPHYFLLRTVMAWLLLVGVIWTSVILGRVPDLGVPTILRMVLILVTIVAALAETIGFRHLSEYLLIGFGGTVIGFGFFKYIANFF
ncbi:MAG: hypothetical protein OQL16_04840, partial [Gammaproteobacteria bacterium]|nr:hypothetical protein [Gammaproteobacteria bacterium]